MPGGSRVTAFECFEMQCRWEGYAPRGLPDTVDASYESLDYVETSSILRRYMDARTPQLWASERWMSMKRYLIVLIIGPLTALVALAIEQSIHFITSVSTTIPGTLFCFHYICIDGTKRKL